MNEDAKNADRSVVKEVLDRVRRVETKLSRMAEQQNIDLGKDDNSITYDEAHDLMRVEHFDVSVSALLRVAKKAGLYQRRIPVFRDAQLLMHLFVGPL